MKSVKRAELSNARMAAGNEKKYTKVILDDILKEWVGIGWVDLHKATAIDRCNYPVVV